MNNQSLTDVVTSTAGPLNAILDELNKVWCPITELKLNMTLENEFIEKLYERFDRDKVHDILMETWYWLDKNYPMLLFDARVKAGELINYSLEFITGKVELVLKDSQLRIKSCDLK